MFRVIDSNPEDAPDEARPKRRRSRQNAWRDGLAAHTVIAGVEDAKFYRVFERAIIASFEPRSAIEHELVLRLVSLFWRLRRATAIETALLQRHIGLDHSSRVDTRNRNEEAATIAHPRLSHRCHHQRSIGVTEATPGALHPSSSSDGPRAHKMAESFWRLAGMGFDPFERAGAYEARLWRQAAQTIWMLAALRRPPAAARRSFRKPLASYFWHSEG